MWKCHYIIALYSGNKEMKSFRAVRNVANRTSGWGCEGLSARGFTSTPVVYGTFPFMSNNTFLKVNPAASHDTPTPFSIAGIPYDGACTNRPGARFGPRSIRDASHMLCDATHPDFHVSPIDYLSDHGDLQFPQTNLVEMRKKLEVIALELLQKSPHVVWLGGDHSVTLSLLRAQYKFHGMCGDMGVSVNCIKYLC